MEKAVVAIVGRPNVGKSQLFNRLLGAKKAIVQDEPGITRDRIYAPCSWEGKKFVLVDTGGLDSHDTDPVRVQVQKQAAKAISEAMLLLFVVDAKEGSHPIDRDIAVQLKKSRKPIILLANKMDNYERQEMLSDFYELGLGDPFPISALHGINIGDLLDLIISHMKQYGVKEVEEQRRVSIVGRRNVGKSSLINALLGEERSIVNNEAGTTRDCVEGAIDLEDMNFLITDTSGLRRKGKIDEKIEYYSAVRTLKAIKDSECVLLVLNAEEGIVFQDKRVAEQIQQGGKSSLIIVNKWDIIEKNTRPELLVSKKEEFIKSIRGELYFIDYSPILFVSAIDKKGIQKILPEVKKVLAEFHKKIETSLVNKIFREAQGLRPAPSYKGQQLRIYYSYQDGADPPSFTLKVNSPRLVHFSYRRYLENYLRKIIGFTGSPVILKFRTKKGD
jgi:GTP-binding protein